MARQLSSGNCTTAEYSPNAARTVAPTDLAPDPVPGSKSGATNLNAEPLSLPIDLPVSESAIVEIEGAVLGSAMTSSARAAEVAALVADDFRAEVNRDIHKTIQRLCEAGTPVDALTVAHTCSSDLLTNRPHLLPSYSAAGERLSEEKFRGYLTIMRKETQRQILAEIGRRIAIATSSGSLREIRADAIARLQQLEVESGAVVPEARISAAEDVPSIWAIETKVDWLIADFVPERSVTLISAEPGAGKTYLALAIAGAVADGSPFAGRTTAKRPVLYVDRENPVAVIKKRLGQLGIKEDASLRIWGTWLSEPPPDPEDRRIRDLASKGGLIVFDSLVAFHPGNENDASETRKFMNAFRQLASLGGTVVLLHHSGKSETAKQYRGSSDVKASVDAAYLIRRSDTSGEIDRLDLEPFKGRISPGVGLSLSFRDGLGFTSCGKWSRNQECVEDAVACIEKDPGITKTKLEKRLTEMGHGRNETRDTLSRPSKKWIVREGSRRSSTYWPAEEDADEGAEAWEEISI